MPIRFFSQDISFTIKKKSSLSRLLLSVIKKEKKKAGEINYIFCSDKFLHSLNKKFLRHNALTDIITFQYPGKTLSAEIFISVHRVKENSKKFETTFENELCRVMIHGILHLCGYKDKKISDKKEMRKKEDFYLGLIK